MLFIKTLVLEFILFLFAVVHCGEPPKLMKEVKKDYTVREGDTVKLRCKVSGTKDPPANRTLTAWQKLPEKYVIITNKVKFRRFRIKPGRSLRIENVTLSDSGTYVCIAKNPYGTIMNNINLIVRASNVTTRAPPVKPNGKPPLFTDESGTTKPPPLRTTTRPPPLKGSLRPSKIPLIDASPPHFRKASKNRISEYVEGQPINLKCHAYGEPPLTITWTKDGKKIKRNRRSHLSAKGWVLKFQFLSSSDGGTYTCTVKNAFGSIQRTFEIKVVADSRREVQERKPFILKKNLKNETADEGDDVTFVCSAVSKSHPEFRWYKWNVSNHDEPLKSVDFTQLKFREIRESAQPYAGVGSVYTHRLIVLNVTAEDEAKYTCVVGNSAGYVSEHAFLVVFREDQGKAYGGISGQDQVTQPPKKTSEQSQAEIEVEDVPLAALIGVPIAVVILLIGTIVWCYFMTSRHRSQHQLKGAQYFPPRQENAVLSSKSSASIAETRNVSKNVYVDCPKERAEPCRTNPLSQQPPGCWSESPKQPPLDGLVVHSEPTLTSSNESCHRHTSDTREPENSECSGSETKHSDL